VKSGVLPAITRLILLLAVAMSFMPVIIYLWKRLAENKAYMVISIFWMINGILYFPDIFHLNWYEPVTLRILLFYNLMDAPIICLIFYFAFNNKLFLYLIGAFIVFEAVVISWNGFNLHSNNIIIAVGSLLCLALNIWGIIKYVKKVKHTNEDAGLIFIFSGFIFYYGLIVDIILISRYLKLTFIQGDPILLINYVAILVATVLISVGFFKHAGPNLTEQTGDGNFR
jgi:uncharacterized membrane protein HdeD (DUF308 family)